MRLDRPSSFQNLWPAAKTRARKAGVDKNLRMVIFGHKNHNEMDLRSGAVDEAELMDAVNKTETYLQTVEGMLTRTKKYPSEEGLKSSNYLI